MRRFREYRARDRPPVKHPAEYINKKEVFM